MNHYFGIVILTTPFFEPRHPRGSFFSSVRVTLKTYGFNFGGRTGRGVLHTPSLTSPLRGRTPIPGYTDDYFRTTARALSCPIGGAYAIRPYPDGRKNMIIFPTTDMQRFPIFIRQTICRPLCIRRNGIGPQAPGKTSCKDAPGNPSVRSGA